jgi:lipoprotein-anchoring transpeptidase ErfK/SrfK
VLSPTGRRRGSWAAVRHTSLGNSRVAWVDTERAPVLMRPRRLELEIDLSRRELVLLSNGVRKRRISVAIGAPDTPTPPGEYYVTDKLPGADFGPYYGCCILALSGHQPNLPQGWSGGDRLAIHGSPTPTWGQNVSNGCLHAREADLRYLLKTVPLGTVVSVHP